MKISPSPQLNKLGKQEMQKKTGTVGRPETDGHSKEQASWWRVMCLTGVDYFSTLGYQPGIAFLAAGILSPVATLIVVLLTFFGALPVYWVVAKRSPHGQGSIAMLERLFPGWHGKTFVLTLLGFAATDFVITITLSAADATAHLLENPLFAHVPFFPHDPVFATSILILALAAIFLVGFREAIGLSVVLVAIYLGLNITVMIEATRQLSAHPELLSNWTHKLTTAYINPFAMLGAAALVFPKLALGLSGFETGVSVMPLVKGKIDDDPLEPKGRIANTRKLLVTAAIIMGALLLTSSVLTTVLIPEEAFKAGGAANGRAISYLAHQYLGTGLGTAYDISTMAILWFAGASAMAGLLTLVPRYLPRYGMAPEWTAATKPLVIFFATVALAVTFIFKANVDAQAAAYATGVLVLMSSAAIAVAITLWKHLPLRLGFLIVSSILLYTTCANITERPDGIVIASFFIASILTISLLSRAVRSLELRIKSIKLDGKAQDILAEHTDKEPIRVIAHRPGGTSYENKLKELSETHGINMRRDKVIFLEVTASDPSEFTDEELYVTGAFHEGYRIFRCESPAVPNAIAALLLYLRDTTTVSPHAYFGWTEGSPLTYIFKYIFLGEGETAPLTREILRTREKNLKKRPVIHVG
jgi:hypothetical protein